MHNLRSKWLHLIQGATWPVLVLLLTQLLSGAWTMPQMSFFPIFLAEEIGLSPVALSSVIALGQAVGMVAALLGGGFTDSLGSKRMMLIGLIIGLAGGLVFLAQLPAIIIVLWGLAAVGLSLQSLGSNSYLTRATDPRRLGLISALYALSITLGGAFSSLAAGWLLDTAGFQQYGAVVIGLGAFTVLLTALFLPRQQPAGARAAQTQAHSSMWAMARRPLMRLLLGLRFLPTVFYGMAGVLIPLLINDLAGNKTTVAVYGTSSLIVASVAQLVSGRAADRYGHRWPTLIGYGALIFSALGLALFSGQLWGVFLFGILGNAAAWSLATLLFVLVDDGVPRAEHGRAFGLLHATWSIAMMTGTLLGGALVRVASGLPFLTAGLLNCLSLVLVAAFFARLGQEGTANRESP